MILFESKGYYNKKMIERKDIKNNKLIFNFNTLRYDFYRKKFQYVSDYDENGILYALGTKFGKDKYINAAGRGLIKLNSSGWNEYVGSINDFISRIPCKSFSKGIQNGFISIDFGQNLKIKLNAYTLRHYKYGYLRNWNLLGSNDGIEWIVIKKYENDETFNKKGQIHTFKIKESECNTYYQYFKIQITDKNTDGDWYIYTTG
eukprot:260195_1